MEEKRCAVVTGGNRGIGYEICRQLALDHGIEVILTARNENRGVEAVKKLHVSGVQNVVFHQLDIKDPTSIQHLVKFIESRYKKLDILVNNAADLGIRYIEDKINNGGGDVQLTDGNGNLIPELIEESYELGVECLKINYYGTKNVTQALVHLLQLSKSPRIVNLTSTYGQLSMFFSHDKLKEEFNNIDKLTVERIDEIVDWFLRDFKASKLQENGWPLVASAYKVSKAAINAYTRLMARKYENKILVNCVNPGYVITEMTMQTGLETPEEGAKGPIMAALLPDDGPSGVYFNQMKIDSFI